MKVLAGLNAVGILLTMALPLRLVGVISFGMACLFPFLKKFSRTRYTQCIYGKNEAGIVSQQVSFVSQQLSFRKETRVGRRDR
jgi:hypothetical protein